MNESMTVCSRVLLSLLAGLHAAGDPATKPGDEAVRRKTTKSDLCRAGDSPARDMGVRPPELKFGPVSGLIREPSEARHSRCSTVYSSCLMFSLKPKPRAAC